MRRQYRGKSLRGVFRYVHSRNGKVLGRGACANAVTLEGVTWLLGAALSPVGRFESSPFSSDEDWYLGQIDEAGFTTGPAPTDTDASHPGWVEKFEIDDYHDLLRYSAMTVDVAAGTCTVRTDPNGFFPATGSIRGFIVLRDPFVARPTVLWSAGALDAPISVTWPDRLDIEYTFGPGVADDLAYTHTPS